jgi:hypothetical protein
MEGLDLLLQGRHRLQGVGMGGRSCPCTAGACTEASRRTVFMVQSVALVR